MSGLEAAIDDLIAEIGRAAWFASCGEALGEAERAEVTRYCAGLGLEPIQVALVPSWRRAVAMTQRDDWSSAWGRAESGLEASLKTQAVAREGEAAVRDALSRVVLAASPIIGPATMALARAGIADEAWARVAAGAAAQACHQAALARAAGAGEDHALAAKLRLFASGRWPLGWSCAITSSEGWTMAIVLQPKYPIPDRSKQTLNLSRDEDGVIDVGWCEGVLSDGRPFRAEMWAQSEISMLTFFFSSAGIEGVNTEEMVRVLESEALFAFRDPAKKNCRAVMLEDDAGSPMWSANIAIGNDDESFLAQAVPIFPYSREGEPNTMLNPVPIKAAHAAPPSA
ncbi:MAG TPA: hypothetical protein VN802_20650 [Stellaceae bacterium]|nr:hypothetical protein [Stellaceae bacterium]